MASKEKTNSVIDAWPEAATFKTTQDLREAMNRTYDDLREGRITVAEANKRNKVARQMLAAVRKRLRA